MGQVVGQISDIFRCNLAAISTGGSKANTILASSEVWLIDSTNSLTADYSGVCDCYIMGDGATKASALDLHRLVDEVPTQGSANPVESNAVYQGLAKKLDAFKEISEDGLYIADKDGNVIMRLDELDVAKLSSHYEYLTGVSGVRVLEEGLYITDMDGYVIQNLIDKTKRAIVNIYTADSEIDVLAKMLSAFSTGNCDVIFERGTYVFSDVYLYMRDTLNWSWTMELPIGNGCHYYFNGSTLISNAPSEAYSDSRNVLGCKSGSMGNTSFKLFDGILINNGGTYCVHDECLSATTPYSHEYHNMRMFYYNGSGTEYLSKCIGGGAGPSGFFIIDNCVFYTNNPTLTSEDVSWHGMAAANKYCNLSFFVTGNSFSRKFRVASSFKSGDTLFVKYNGNNSAADPIIATEPSTLETCIFNNIINA